MTRNGWSETEKAVKLIRGIKDLPCEDTLRKLWLLRLEKRRLYGDLIATMQYPKGPTGTLEQLFCRNSIDRTRSNGYKLKQGKFYLYIRKKFFTVRLVRHWKMLPREAVDAPALGVFIPGMDGALSSLI
ncbi:hypothetical protein DUI87_18928 [Hirundo rustica rustica]|uniref:Uncharacterized protein n=1 Tax=Hirundo rustica rustica TaxID=333673 RepID=A0A3M0JTW1_HIRRU|nr:hypothetical protein DUI87_18928 [Hirundo rustica rustica]